jgi:hypothetical protein
LARIHFRGSFVFWIPFWRIAIGKSGDGIQINQNQNQSQSQKSLLASSGLIFSINISKRENYETARWQF